jgi:RNA polymerase sigma-70 factor (ECF subfamily)
MLRPSKYQDGASDSAEARLLERVAARDGEAFRELYATYHRRLSRFLWRITRRHDLIEEIINDTLWVVWRKASQYRGESRISTWIMSIAYRIACRALASAGAHAKAEVPEAELMAASVEESGVAETSDWILKAMALLPLEQKLVIEFAYGYGHSCEEIALIMDCPINTVKTRLFHARGKLRQLLPCLAGERANE